MSKMTIDVEFLAGTSIEEAVKEAKHKAVQWDVAYVCFNFNGVSMSIGKNADVQEAVEKWNNALSSLYKFAVVN